MPLGSISIVPSRLTEQPSLAESLKKVDKPHFAVPLLGPGETTIQSERTESGTGRDGVLTLTSWRLVFEGEAKQGLVTQIVRGKRLVTLVDVRLDQLSNVYRDKPLLGRATLRIDAFGRSHTFRVRDAEAWANTIARARQSVPPQGAPYAGQGAPVVVNVQAAPPPPPPQTFLHCRYCGALNPAQNVGAGMRCTSCGATL